jgi:hypothetical protein
MHRMTALGKKYYHNPWNVCFKNEMLLKFIQDEVSNLNFHINVYVVHHYAFTGLFLPYSLPYFVLVAAVGMN